MIKVSHEMPLCLLKDGTEGQVNDYFYALVHLFEDHPDYYDYTVEQLKNGREVILDNSAYELHGKPFDTTRFVYWINRLNEDIAFLPIENKLTYIIPDEFDDAEKTYWTAVNFLAENRNIPAKAMVVCQGENIKELSDIFDKYLALPQIYKIGINFMSKAYTTWCSLQDSLKNYGVWEQRFLGRRFFVEYLYHADKLGKKKIHLLGAALPFEFAYYTQEHPVLEHFIDSMDTSAPIIQGLFSEELYSLKPNALAILEKRPEKIAEHLLDPVSEIQKLRILHNVEVFRAYNGM